MAGNSWHGTAPNDSHLTLFLRNASLDPFAPPPSYSSSLPIAPHHSSDIYPALLSQVAKAFQSRISLRERVKDGVVYPGSFDGHNAVDQLLDISKATDRNHVLLLDRALDAQKFFHDVACGHRLRDSPAELYRLREPLARPKDLMFEGVAGEVDRISARVGGELPVAESADGSVGARMLVPGAVLREEVEGEFPSGVFTLFTECYSPTCTADQPCYSIACPRRVHSQAKLHPSLDNLADDFKERRLPWIDSVRELARTRLGW